MVVAFSCLAWTDGIWADPGTGVRSPGQRTGQSRQQAPARRARAEPQAVEEEELGPPETISVTTKDKVVLKCTYYPGEKSKTTVPFILLHDWNGNRKDMLAMAEYLQQNHKFAVIVPDLRGHGGSTTVVGADKPLDASRFKKGEAALVVNDIERCKKFLMEKNNKGELNIEMLTIVAVGKLGVAAVQWALADWQWQPIGGLKQGQDVKAVMLISPERKMKGSSITPNLKTNLFTGKGTTPLAVYLTWSAKDDVAAREGNAIAKALERPRAKLDDPLLLVRQPYNTNLDGTGLVRDPKHKIVFQDVAKFVNDNLTANKEQMPWQNRSRD